MSGARAEPAPAGARPPAWARRAWLAVYLGALLLSGVHPADTFTWALEVAPAVIGLGVVLATYRRFPLTPLVYGLILAHAIVLMVGGHYTYAEVPLFDDLAALLGRARNDYDKVGHFAQGFVPVMVARELVIRLGVIRAPRWRTFFLLCFVLALSAAYELLEWGVAEATGESAEAFLGTQGYVWDTQSDMLMAIIGAGVALLTLAHLHDRQLRRLVGHAPGGAGSGRRFREKHGAPARGGYLGAVERPVLRFVLGTAFWMCTCAPASGQAIPIARGGGSGAAPRVAARADAGGPGPGMASQPALALRGPGGVHLRAGEPDRLGQR